MEKYINYIIGGFVVIVLAVGGFYIWSRGKAVTESTTKEPQAVATTTYATSTFAIVYPSDFSVNTSYAYDQFGPKKLINGVKFIIPESMATGTNLSSNDTGISVEYLPRAQKCTGDIYIQADVKASVVTENGVEYSVASTTGAGAGNFYEEQVYALAGSKPCTAVRYFIHSSNIGNYPPNTVREFDRTALLSAFDTIRHSLTLVR